MNENYESHQQETPAPQKSKIPKAAWYVGGGCLILLCCVAVVALGVAGYLYFSGKDPIASAVPGSSLMYANFDFLKTQSDDFNKIVPIFQGIAEVEKKPLVDMIEEEMQNSLDMSFKEEVMPWMGQHGAFVITGGDIQSGDFEFMFITETRNKSLADEFITKYVAAMENKNGMKFDQKDVDGVTFHISQSGSGRNNDMVVARSGSLIYFANAEAPVISSINLKSADSIASSDKYKETMSALPASRIASFYMSGDVIATFMSELSKELATASASQMVNDSISGVGITMLLEDEGLRFDAAVAYDENKLNDFQKEALKAKYSALKTDQLLPEDTFFFAGVNSSQSPSKTFQDNNPAYNQDVKEALDLLEQQYNVSLKELFAMLTGEFSIAVSPSDEGLLASEGQVNVGITLFAGTDNETGFNDWAKNALDAASKNSFPVTTTDVAVENYNLHQVSAEGVGDLVLYGADKGYIFMGTSQDILEKGLSGSNTLAKNAVYRDTWKAFPSTSVPYIYANLSGILDLYKNMPYSDLGNAEADLRKIPVIAAARNQNSGYVSSITMIMFINTK